MALVLLLCLNKAVSADPWVPAGDVRTRHHLLVLIDHGAINLPANAWPLMWNDIKLQLDAVDITQLSQAEVWSYRFLKHELRRAQQGLSGYISFYKATNRSLTPSSNTEIEPSERRASVSLLSNHFAAKLQGSFVQSPLDDDDQRFDGSFVAASVGNWVLGAGKLDRWWGPGWQSSLLLSNNARPATSVFLNRSDSVAFPRFLPWTLSAFASRLGDEGDLPEQEMRALRLAMKPIPYLEVGGQHIQVLSDEIESSPESEFEFQGLDWRLSFNLGGFFQCGFYQQIARRSDEAMAEEPEALLAGLEASFNLYNMHHRLVVESSESDPGFSDNYNYFGRDIGYMTGESGEAQSVLGFHFLPNGHQIEWLATKAKVETWPEELKYAQIAYRFPFGDNMLISFGALHYVEKFRLDDGEYIRPGNFIKLEYAF